MTGEFFLDWAVMAVSLFNTILMLWLGLTVLLNAERRTWGVWLAGGGLLMGGAFFVSHSAILGHSLTYSGQGLDFWWHVGWAPVIASPFAWYVVVLWYAGFWDSRQTPLHRRQRPWFVLTVLLSVGLAGLLLFANPLPSYWQVTQLQLSATPSVGGIPLLILVYPLYIVLCISLSLDVLRRPGPSGRVMGDLARQRARPWLIAASVALLLVSLLVAWVILWVMFNARYRTPDNLSITFGMVLTVAWFDLVIASLIAAAVILQGQAIVSYEVFTGKTLPRRGFRRYWFNAIILAAGYGVVVGWSLVIQLRPVYSLLITTILMTVFYALLSWRSFAEREHTIGRLRPFVASQRLYDHLLTRSSSAPPDVDVATPFRALCDDVLGARVAYLAALGPLAPLVGPPLAHPEGTSTTLPSLTEVAARLDSPQAMCIPLEDRPGDAHWAVPLWSERGLIGALLLGDKRGGSPYTQEEIEIARAVGERLIDTRASAEMARRLMALQRQRLAESQVLDRQARRALHDDVLPRLHTAMLALSSQQVLEGDRQALEGSRQIPERDPQASDREQVPDQGQAAADETSEAMDLLADVHRRLSDLLREMPAVAAPEVSRRGLVGALRQAVDDELGSAFDAVTWEVEPQAEREARAIPPLTAEVLFYAAREAIRNAGHHGRGPDAARPLHLRLAVAWREGLTILVEDDGVGLATGGRSNDDGGQGLALHSTMMAVVGGSLAVESLPGAYTRVLLSLPRV